MTRCVLLLGFGILFFINFARLQGIIEGSGDDDYFDDDDEIGSGLVLNLSNFNGNNWRSRRSGTENRTKLGSPGKNGKQRVEKNGKKRIWKEIRREVKTMKNFLPNLASNLSYMELDVREMNRNYFSIAGDVRFIKNEVMYIKRQAHVIWENVTDTRKDHKSMNRSLWWILGNVTQIVDNVDKTSKEVTDIAVNYGSIAHDLNEAVHNVVDVSAITNNLRDMSSEFSQIRTSLDYGSTKMTGELNVVRDIISHLSQTIVDIKENVMEGFEQVDYFINGAQSRILANVSEVGTKINQHDGRLLEITNTVANIGNSLMGFSSRVNEVWDMMRLMGGHMDQVGTNVLKVSHQVNEFHGNVGQVNEKISNVGYTVGHVGRQIDEMGHHLGAFGTQFVGFLGTVNDNFNKVHTRLGDVHDRVLTNMSSVKEDLQSMKGQLKDIRKVIAEKCEGAPKISFPPSGIGIGQLPPDLDYPDWSHSMEDQIHVTTEHTDTWPPTTPSNGVPPSTQSTSYPPIGVDTDRPPTLPHDPVHPSSGPPPNGYPSAEAYPYPFPPSSTYVPTLPTTTYAPTPINGYPIPYPPTPYPPTAYPPIYPQPPTPPTHPPIYPPHPTTTQIYPTEYPHPPVPPVYPQPPSPSVHPPHPTPPETYPAEYPHPSVPPVYPQPPMPPVYPPHPTTTQMYPPEYPHPPVPPGYPQPPMPPIYPPHPTPPETYPVEYPHPSVPPGYPQPPMPPIYPPHPTPPETYPAEYPHPSVPPGYPQPPMPPAYPPHPTTPQTYPGEYPYPPLPPVHPPHPTTPPIPGIPGIPLPPGVQIQLPQGPHGPGLPIGCGDEFTGYCACVCPCDCTCPVFNSVQTAIEQSRYYRFPYIRRTCQCLCSCPCRSPTVIDGRPMLPPILPSATPSSPHIPIFEPPPGPSTPYVPVFDRPLETTLPSTTQSSISNGHVPTPVPISPGSPKPGQSEVSPECCEELKEHITHEIGWAVETIVTNIKNFKNYLYKDFYEFFDGIVRIHLDFSRFAEDLKKQLAMSVSNVIATMDRVNSNLQQLYYPWIGMGNLDDRSPAVRPPALPPIFRPGINPPEFTPPGQYPSYVPNKPQVRPSGRPQLAPSQFIPYRPTPRPQSPHGLPLGNPNESFPANLPIGPHPRPPQVQRISTLRPPDGQVSRHQSRPSRRPIHQGQSSIDNRTSGSLKKLAPLSSLETNSSLITPITLSNETISTTTDTTELTVVARRSLPIGNNTEQSTKVLKNSHSKKKDKKNNNGCIKKKKTKAAKSHSSKSLQTGEKNVSIADAKYLIAYEDNDNHSHGSDSYGVQVRPEGVIKTPGTELVIPNKNVGIIDTQMDPLAFNNMLQEHINNQLTKADQPGSSHRIKGKRRTSRTRHGRGRNRYKLRPKPLFSMMPKFPFIQPPMGLRPPIPPIPIPIPPMPIPNPLAIRPPRLPNRFGSFPPGMMVAGINGSPYSVSYNDGKGNSWNVNVNRRNYDGASDMKPEEWTALEDELEEQDEDTQEDTEEEIEEEQDKKQEQRNDNDADESPENTEH